MLMIIFFVVKNLKNLPLSEILDINKIKDVTKPIEHANGLPNECYINNDYLDDELLNGNISIEIEKIKYPAEIIFKPLKQTNFKNN